MAFSLTFVPTKTPRYFDPSLSDFKRPASFENSKLRIKVKVPEGVSDYWHLLDKAREQAEKKYPGALIYALPEFEESADHLGESLETGTDELLVRSYVKSIAGKHDEQFQSQVISYVLSKLNKIGISVLNRGKVEVLGFEAKNFLSFKKCEFSFKPGMYLLSGENLDWNGGSNGAGKSNFLQMVRAGWYGSTTKGQSVSNLVHSKFRTKRSSVSVLSRVGDSSIEVVRQRNPTRIRLLVDGIDQSSGNRRTRKRDSTEDLIVRRLGFTEEMFDHSILIDQNLIHTTSAFFSGTDKQKKELLDSFLGTDRFLQAGALVRQDLKRFDEESESLASKKALLRERKDDLEEAIADLEKQGSRIAKLKKSIKSLEDELASLKEVNIEFLLKRQRGLSGALKAARKGHEDCFEGISDNRSQLRSLEQAKKSAEILKAEGACPTCKQPVSSKYTQEWMNSLERDIQHVSAVLASQERDRNSKKKAIADMEAEWDEISSEISEAKDSNAHRKSLQSGYEILKKNLEESVEAKLLASYQKKLSKVKESLRMFAHGKKSLRERRERMEFSERVLSRDGLVNYLYGKLCVRLNKAAERYSEILMDGIIGLRFIPYSVRKNGEVVNEFDVQVVNTQGGESRWDQSRSEEQIACLVCILALREIGPECNLLILDEPSEGLEPANAARLAEGLNRLSSRFSTILLATHNEHIKSRFKGVGRGIIIRKVGKVSSVKEV